MGIIQDSFDAVRGKAYAGTLARAHGNVIDSGVVIKEDQGATETLRMGRVAVKPSASNPDYSDQAVQEYRGQGTVFLGIAIRQFMTNAFTALEVAGDTEMVYRNNGTADLLTHGSVYVKVNATIAKGSVAMVDANGNFVATGGTHTIPGTMFMESGVAGDILELAVNGKTIMEVVS